jgi:hypothetical protein
MSGRERPTVCDPLCQHHRDLPQRNPRPKTASTPGALRAMKSLHKRSSGLRAVPGAPLVVDLMYLSCTSGLDPRDALAAEV